MAIAPTSVSATSADTAATHAYLEARYAFVQASLTNLPQSIAAVDTLASRLASECPGVLAEAQTSELPGSSARAFGERIREQEQLHDLEEELGAATSAVSVQADRPAAQTFADAVSALSWSDPAITELAHREAVELEESIDMEAPNVCADADAWAASGHKTLSAATKAFLSQQSEEQSRLQHEHLPRRSLASSIAPFEGPSEQAIVRATKALEESSRESDRPLDEALNRAASAVGITGRESEAFEGPPKGSVVVGQGRTASGEKFVARLEPPEKGIQRGCKLSLSISIDEMRAGPSGGFRSSSSGVCVSRTLAPEASVNCASGRLTIEAHTLSATRNVRLLLSDGRSITSRVIEVPARLGGPATLYFQVVRGPSPIPVSLTELDARGRTLRTIGLPAVVECTENPVKHLPGGRRTLARGQAPNGPRFTITAERYKFLGHIYFELKVHTSPQSASSGRVVLYGRPRRPPAFHLEESSGCSPHLYDIVYGILKQPGETVLVRVGGALTALTKVATPASLHASGVLVFGAFASPPTEVVVHNAHGSTTFAQSLAESARSTIEQCEGEAEPGASGSSTAVGSAIGVGHAR